MNNIKLSVSNLAWPLEDESWCLEQLIINGISGVELAPLKVIGSWDSITNKNVAEIKSNFTRLGLKISSFQAITFGVDDLALFNDKLKIKNFINHMENVAKLLNMLDGDYAVFGSPGLRNSIDFDVQELKVTFSRLNSVFKKNVRLV